MVRWERRVQMRIHFLLLPVCVKTNFISIYFVPVHFGKRNEKKPEVQWETHRRWRGISINLGVDVAVGWWLVEWNHLAAIGALVESSGICKHSIWTSSTTTFATGSRTGSIISRLITRLWVKCLVIDFLTSMKINKCESREQAENDCLCIFGGKYWLFLLCLLAEVQELVLCGIQISAKLRSSTTVPNGWVDSIDLNGRTILV